MGSKCVLRDVPVVIGVPFTLYYYILLYNARFYLVIAYLDTT
jgi:hypothetical protein